ncbi:fatty acid desaturase [Paracrocinitomix mangrovi]|uniref:fatty acid desaturase n=1 Tax=Paracrocinitomix mangrovi TaxID=2862509 RepID=UPI001C8ECD87|nr:fatty acid desaturase [Paracrocinitomix mangrovi]UKN00249.1 fatty acid desaturase [Paracrocinitomix mangrovi]
MSANIEKTVYINLARYTQPDAGKSWWVFLSASIGAALFMFLGFYVYQFGWYYSLIAYPFVWIFWSRLFIIVHDCGHKALFKDQLSNDIAGTIAGAFTTVPLPLWRFIHDQHHKAVGHLEKRPINPDLWTLTVEEYKKASIVKKLIYRFMRNGMVRVFIAPAMLFILGRFPFPNLSWQSNVSIIAMDIVLFGVGYLVYVNDAFLMVTIVYLIPLYVWLSFAAMMFYMQHQFEDTHWYEGEDWSNYKASIHGSSYMHFGPFMTWMTGNVGYHHIHHLNAGIPFYKLKKANASVAQMLKVKPISFWNCIPSLKKKLWDENKRELVPFKDI